MSNTTFEIEIFNTLEEEIQCHVCSDDENYSTETYQVVNNICIKLLNGYISYTRLLEDSLGKIIRLTNSEIGIFLAQDNISQESNFICMAAGERTSGNISQDFINSSSPDRRKGIKGIFGHIFLENKVIISNDYPRDERWGKSDLPENHPFIKKLMGIPLCHHRSNIGIIALAKSKEDFSLDDFRKIAPLIDICSLLLERTIDSSETMVHKIQKVKTVDEVKDQFLATMSHEIRTPLNGILGMVTLLPDAGELNKKQAEYILNLTECTVELTNLLNNILDFSKMTSNRLILQKQKLSIGESINDAVKIVEGTILTKKLKLTICNPHKELPNMIGDRQRLIQILTNLLSNAIKFTEEGDINIEVEASQLSSDTPKKWKILFNIQDTGVGIPPEEQDKIFDVFHQSPSLSTYHSKSGTGLGLSIVRELVRLMGGEISVRSNGVPGDGSTFTFYITLEEEINISQILQSHEELKNAKILIVDDRPEIRLQLTDILFQWGCVPQAVSSAKEALQYLQHGIEFRVALVDICMPNMSGIELAQELRLKYPNLPLIGISSVELSSGEEYFDHYMYKPIDQNNLLPSLISCLTSCSAIRSIIPSEKRRERKLKGQLKIVVAEDNRRNAYTISEMLESIGYCRENIFTAENGKKCVEMVKNKLPDVVLMDIIMPLMDGIEASKIIKRLSNPPMIIAVSAAVQPSDKAQCQGVGIDGYLEKPIIREKFAAALSPLIIPDDQ